MKTVWSPSLKISLRTSPTASYGMTDTPSASISRKLSSVSWSRVSSSFLTNQTASDWETKRYEITYGLYSMSSPLTLRSQAISSRADMRMLSQSLTSRNFLSSVSLSYRDLPTVSSERVIIGDAGMSGLPSHIPESMSGTSATMHCSPVCGRNSRKEGLHGLRRLAQAVHSD